MRTVLAVLVLLCSAVCHPAAAADCPLLVFPGESVKLTVWYEHEAEIAPGVGAGRVWLSVDTAAIAEPQVAIATAEGHPAAITWWIDGQYATTCGVLPAWVFSDNYELGHLSRWSAIHGGT